MKCRLPPYGRELQHKRQQSRTWWGGDQVCICVGSEAWRQAKDWLPSRLVLVCPPDDDPASFDWRLAAGDDGHWPAIYPCGTFDPDQIDALAAHLLAVGAHRVVVYYEIGSVVYRAKGAAA